MNMKQAGFTLIELVMVIVILGILAAVAVPKFIDLSTEAKDAAAQGVAGAVSSAFAVNYAAFAANPAKGSQINGAFATNGVWAAAGSVLASTPAGYSASVGAPFTCASNSAGSPYSIAVYNTATTSASASATLICTG